MGENEIIDSETQAITKKYLQKRITEKSNELIRTNRHKKFMYKLGIGYILMAISMIGVASPEINILPISDRALYFWSFPSLLLGLFLVLISSEQGILTRAQLELNFMEDDLELFDDKNQDIEIKADKQFRLNQRELKRYYDLNLSQTKFLSKLGIFLMMGGVLIITSTVYVYFVSTNSSVTLLLTGSVSGILVNFLGAMFITTYTKTFEAAIRFHSKLANSNNLLLANAIASKIKDESLRNETLSEVAKNISRLKDSD